MGQTLHSSFVFLIPVFLSFCVSISCCVSNSCVFVFLCLFSQGPGVWESVAAGHPAVSASLLSEFGPLETSLWSSVQPHYVWTAKGKCGHKPFSCITNGSSYIITAVFFHWLSWSLPFDFSPKPGAQCEFFIVLGMLIPQATIFFPVFCRSFKSR